MRRFILILSLLAAPVLCRAQVFLTPDPVLERQIVASSFIHAPLPLDRSRSVEAEADGKQVLAEEPLAGEVVLTYRTDLRRRAQGPADDPDYATFGNSTGSIVLGGRDLEGWNRLAFRVYPDCEGGRVTCLNLAFHNSPDVPDKPGYRHPTGAHLIPLTNRAWNTCYLELDEFQRDRVDSLAFFVYMKGRDLINGDTAKFTIDDIRLQLVSVPERLSGWQPMAGRIICSSTGYRPGDRKTAIISEEPRSADGTFTLEDEDGRTVWQGPVETVSTTLGRYGVLDFSAVKTPGRYILRTGSCTSHPFRISDRLWEDSAWRVVNYIFCQRCGYPVPGVHSACHKDLFAVHDGRALSYGGGWHDAGDLSQQTLQTGDITYSLLEAWCRYRDDNPALAARLLEEARWGLEFLLRTRFGDGYHASSMGLLHWTDGEFGTYDDITTVRVQDLAFDNFLYAAYEAYAAMTLPDDHALRDYLRRIAEEDFGFAYERFRTEGFEPFRFIMEHSYNTSRSQYMATVAWSASQLYRLTGAPRYAAIAADAARYVLDCQETEAPGINGYFYRDTDRVSIVHYIHQSREQVYMQALTLLCETQPDHPDRNRWAAAIRRYGDYLKALMPCTAPYGLVPSGVYKTDEYRDTEGFRALHIFAPDDAVERYGIQVRGGVRIDADRYVKRFPVWFNIFSGNTAVHLSTGKSAALAGRFLGDPELLRIGVEQLYWTVGKNPFGQSLIYGEGWRYPSMSSFSSGELTGEMPVGIRTVGDGDIPYWPEVNNACYKEVWVTSAGKWMSLIAEY